MAMLSSQLRPFLEAYEHVPQYTSSVPNLRSAISQLVRILRVFRQLVELVDESYVEQWDRSLAPDQEVPRWMSYVARAERVVRSI